MIRIEQLYDYLTNEEDARVCKDISGDACREVPGNFFLILLAQFFTKLGDALSSTKIVLPWLLSGVGAPAFFSGLLAPVRESGSLIPQLLIGGVIRAYPLRKWFFVVGCLLQALSVAGMALVVLHCEGMRAGAFVLFLVIVFSLARGLCSVASKDVLGKTIPKTRRGRVNGLSASLAGVLTIVVGVALLLGVGKDSFSYAYILLFGAGCWVVAAVGYARIEEYSGETDGGGNAFKEALKSLRILREERDFLRFVIARCLLISSGLVLPYIVLLAERNSSASLVVSLGMFVALSGLASLLSGHVWGMYADSSSRRVLLVSSFLVACLSLVTALLAFGLIRFSLVLALFLFFTFAVAHQGVRLGRKTYVVDLADGNKRTDYVSVSNTIIGVMLLLIGFLAALMAQFSLAWTLVLFAVMSVSGFVLIYFMPEV